MSDEATPNDVAALLSRTQLTSYKVFGDARQSGTHDADAPANHKPPAPRPVAEVRNAAGAASKLEVVRPQPPRWALLQELAEGSNTPAQQSDAHELLVPTFAVCSTGGGSGKTTIAATLGRALSLTGSNILLIHGGLQPSAPLHFGAQCAGTQLAQPGRLRSFVPPQRDQGTVHILSHQFDEEVRQDEESGDWLLREVNSLQGEIDGCIVEISSPRGDENLMVNMAQTCLIVLTPDVNSVMAIAPFRTMPERKERPGKQKTPGVYFLLNKFDPASAFHAEVRQNLRTQLGSRLLPFCIRRSDVIAESLAAGMTVLDYAPSSAPAEDFVRLANWAREIGASLRAHGAV